MNLLSKPKASTICLLLCLTISACSMTKTINQGPAVSWYSLPLLPDYMVIHSNHFALEQKELNPQPFYTANLAQLTLNIALDDSLIQCMNPTFKQQLAVISDYAFQYFQPVGYSANLNVTLVASSTSIQQSHGFFVSDIITIPFVLPLHTTCNSTDNGRDFQALVELFSDLIHELNHVNQFIAQRNETLELLERESYQRQFCFKYSVPQTTIDAFFQQPDVTLTNNISVISRNLNAREQQWIDTHGEESLTRHSISGQQRRNVLNDIRQLVGQDTFQIPLTSSPFVDYCLIKNNH